MRNFFPLLSTANVQEVPFLPSKECLFRLTSLNFSHFISFHCGENNVKSINNLGRYSRAPSTHKIRVLVCLCACVTGPGATFLFCSTFELTMNAKRKNEKKKKIWRNEHIWANNDRNGANNTEKEYFRNFYFNIWQLYLYYSHGSVSPNNNSTRI